MSIIIKITIMIARRNGKRVADCEWNCEREDRWCGKLGPGKVYGGFLGSLQLWISSLPLKVFGQNHFDIGFLGAWPKDLIGYLELGVFWMVILTIAATALSFLAMARACGRDSVKRN